MATTTTDRLTDDGRRIMKDFKEIEKKPHVKVGVLSRNFGEKKRTSKEGKEKGQGWSAGQGEPATLGEVAVFAEFGTKTEPERSFLRSTVDAEWSRWSDYAKKLRDEILGGMPVEKALGLMGERIKADVQRKIRSNIPPPNAPSTLAAKFPKTKTLINTGQLLNSIAWELINGGGDQS